MDDLRSGDVGGHQVGGELDPAEVQAQAVRQGPDQQGLGEAGNTLDDAVPLGEDRDEQLLDNLVLSHDDLADLCPELFKARLHTLDGAEVRFLCHRLDLSFLN